MWDGDGSRTTLLLILILPAPPFHENPHNRITRMRKHQAAGLQAVRKNRYVILPADFEEAFKTITKRGDDTKMDFYT